MGPDGPLGTIIGGAFGIWMLVISVFFIFTMWQLFHENRFKDYVDKNQVNKPKNRFTSIIFFVIILWAIGWFLFVGLGQGVG